MTAYLANTHWLIRYNATGNLPTHYATGATTMGRSAPGTESHGPEVEPDRTGQDQPLGATAIPAQNLDQIPQTRPGFLMPITQPPAQRWLPWLQPHPFPSLLTNNPSRFPCHHSHSKLHQ